MKGPHVPLCDPNPPCIPEVAAPGVNLLSIISIHIFILLQHFMCHMCMLSCFSLRHLTLCNPMDCSWPGSSVLGILQQEYWSGLPCPPSENLPDPGIAPVPLMSPALPLASPGKPVYVSVNVICDNGLQILKNKWYHTVYILLFFHSALYF